MEAKKSKIIGVAVTITLIVLITVSRISLGLSKSFFLILGVGVAGIFATLTWIWTQDRADSRIERELVYLGQQLRVEYSFLRKVGGLPTKFKYKDIEAATDNFQALLGRGGSGLVFKGILDDGTTIAVKQIAGVEHGEKEFQAEVAAIANVQHVNLVRLLGYSSFPGGCPRLLVFEFVYNGSLDGWIFPQHSTHGIARSSCLPWRSRYRVAIDVAKALAYLHHDCRSRILHLDVKPENILLDENFRAVVTDFGLSKLMGRDESRVYTTVRGTKGYLAPEWLLENGISEKSDIYSYGMVLFEMVGGRRNVRLIEDGSEENRQKKWSYFPKIVIEKMRQGKLMEVVDERIEVAEKIRGREFEREVRTLVFVALWCIQEDPRLRPSMSRVIDMLEGRLGVDAPPETEMIVVDLLSIDSEESSDGTAFNKLRPKVHNMLQTHAVETQVPPTSAYSFAASVLYGR